MSLFPMMCDLYHDELEYPFGMGYHAELFNPRYRHGQGHGHYMNFPRLQMPAQLESRRRNLRNRTSEELAGLQHVGKDGFQVNLEVQHFAPNEITIKTVDNSIVVEGNHEEKEDDHGHISRRFVRRYTLPNGFDAKDVVSTLSSDGILTVKAPPAAKAIESKERIVEIQQTGPAHLSIKPNTQEEAQKEKKMEE